MGTWSKNNSRPITAPLGPRTSRPAAPAEAPAGIDEAKVARLREALREGTLVLDAWAIAARLVPDDGEPALRPAGLVPRRSLKRARRPSMRPTL